MHEIVMDNWQIFINVVKGSLTMQILRSCYFWFLPSCNWTNLHHIEKVWPGQTQSTTFCISDMLIEFSTQQQLLHWKCLFAAWEAWHIKVSSITTSISINFSKKLLNSWDQNILRYRTLRMWPLASFAENFSLLSCTVLEPWVVESLSP